MKMAYMKTWQNDARVCAYRHIHSIIICVYTCGPPGGLTLVRNGYNEHLAGSRAFRGHWRQSWNRGIFPLCHSIWHCLTFSFRDRGPAGLQVRLEADGEQEMEPACANTPTNPSPCVRLYICQHLPDGGLAPPFLQITNKSILCTLQTIESMSLVLSR